MLLDTLWERYAAQVPSARTFMQLAGAFKNDHVAFRSLEIERVAPLFEALGWRRADAYGFPDARLNAIYLNKPGEPRIFISELRQAELSARARELLARLPAPETFTGDAEWPYAYLEIAERNGGFDGFVAAQARQLFEMTRR